MREQDTASRFTNNQNKGELQQRIIDLMVIINDMVKEYRVLSNLIPDTPDNHIAKEYLTKLIIRKGV
jgi:hypothetical protein